MVLCASIVLHNFCAHPIVGSLYVHVSSDDICSSKLLVRFECRNDDSDGKPSTAEPASKLDPHEMQFYCQASHQLRHGVSYKHEYTFTAPTPGKILTQIPAPSQMPTPVVPGGWVIGEEKVLVTIITRKGDTDIS